MKAPKCAICGSEHWSRQPCSNGKAVLVGGITFTEAAAAMLAKGGNITTAAEMAIKDPRPEQPRVPGPPKEGRKPKRAAGKKAAPKRKGKARA